MDEFDRASDLPQSNVSLMVLVEISRSANRVTLDSDEWREVNTTAAPRPPALYGAVGGVSGNYFYVAMGRGLDGVYYNDVWRLDLR